MVLQIFTGLLFLLSQLMLWVKRPTIIGVTGNFGKTSTVAAIVAVLRTQFSVRGPEKNFNNEIGVPLTILGWPNHGKNILGWLVELIRYPFQLFVMPYPSILVLEMGVDKPGDMAYLTKLVRPHVAVVTGVGEIPVHVEFFNSPEALSEEKAGLVRSVRKGGLVILNADDLYSAAMRKDVAAPVRTYGTSHLSDIRVEQFEIHYGEHALPDGMSFTLSADGAVHPVHLSGSLNLPQALSAAATYAVGAYLGVKPVEIIESIKKLKTPNGRMKLISGSHGSLILDDTYNAAPKAVESALVTLASIKASRKIAILGDMKELGTYTKAAHKKIGELARDLGIIVIGVGAEMKEIPNVKHFENSLDAARNASVLIKEGDVILVKGAQSMRMERVVESLMAEPAKALELLVRQTKDWKNKE